MIFISAGHHNQDPGASGKGTTEAAQTKIMRDKIVAELQKLGCKFITDNDNETLSQYLKRIETGSGSVVLELHFDAFNKIATGSTALMADDATAESKAFSAELVATTAKVLGIPNRGAKGEGESNRGRLGLMREHGTVCLLEVCFIDNENDMQKYYLHRDELAVELAKIIKKYEDLK
jgi:N-acetylmuramoyl-L-alanine amidase